jgi:hypothetical protein
VRTPRERLDAPLPEGPLADGCAALPPATLPQVTQQLGLNAATPAPAVKGKPRATH